MTRPKATRNATPHEVVPAVAAEDGVADELDAVVERVERAEHLRPLGELARAGRTCPATRNSGVSTALTM